MIFRFHINPFVLSWFYKPYHDLCHLLVYCSLSLSILSLRSHTFWASTSSQAALDGSQRQQLLKYIPPTPSSSEATAQYTVVAAPCCCVKKTSFYTFVTSQRHFSVLRPSQSKLLWLLPVAMYRKHYFTHVKYILPVPRPQYTVVAAACCHV